MEDPVFKVLRVMTWQELTF